MTFFLSPQNFACILAIFLKHIIPSSLVSIVPIALFFQSAKSSITRTDLTLEGLFITTYLAKLLSPLSSNPIIKYRRKYYFSIYSGSPRVSVQGVKLLGGHFACLCRGFEFYEVKKKIVIIFQKENGNTFTLFIIFIVKSLQKVQNSTNLLL